MVVLVLVFNKKLISNGYEFVPHCVGTLMWLYAIENIIMIILVKEVKKEIRKFLNEFVLILFGFILWFVVPTNENSVVITACLWSVWAIMRETDEIEEKILFHKNNIPVLLINSAIFLLVLVFSVLMIADPHEEHLYLHIILMGVELLSEAITSLLCEIEFFRESKEIIKKALSE